MATHEPLFNAPGVVTGLIAAFVVVHVCLWLLPPDMALMWTVMLGFSPARYTAGADALPGGAIAGATSFLTHAFVHGDWVHLALNSAWMLAFGSAVARRIGDVRFLALFVFGAVCGALAFLAVNFGGGGLVIGASGAISAMMGAAFRFIFRAMQVGGSRNVIEASAGVARLSVREVLTDRSMLGMIAIYVVTNAVFALFSGGLSSLGGIAWEAHLGGFFAGLLGFALFDRRGGDRPPPRLVTRNGAPHTLH